MVSATEVGGDNTHNDQTAWKNQLKPNNKKPMEFTGDTKAESIINQKVITSGANQAGQVIAIVSNLSSYIEDKVFPHWAESISRMHSETQDNRNLILSLQNASHPPIWTPNALLHIAKLV